MIIPLGKKSNSPGNLYVLTKFMILSETSCWYLILFSQHLSHIRAFGTRLIFFSVETSVNEALSWWLK